jgi:predicted O-methyltransferase YrrM
MTDVVPADGDATSPPEAQPAMTFALAWRRVAGIEGWLSELQARFLAAAARGIPESSWIVEIGSHHGKATVLMATMKPKEAGLLAVDPYNDPRWGGGRDALAVFESNLRVAEVADEVELFRGTSVEAAGEWHGARIGLLYVDGAHDRHSVLKDIDAWEAFVTERGLLLFHDAFSSVGVTLAVLQRLLVNRRFRYLRSVASLAIFRREDEGASAVAADAFRLTGRLGYFARNLLVKLALRRGWFAAAALLGHHDQGDPF